MRRALLFSVLVACGSSDPAPPSEAPVEPAPPTSIAPPTTGAIDPRDPYTMVDDMRTAERVPAAEQPEAIANVRTSWEGHRFRWEMMRVQGLCTQAQSCLFAPYDLARFDRVVDLGYLPRVVFDAPSFATLGERCASFGGTCVVTLEATLERFTFAIDEPTTLTLSQPTVIDARNIREGEYFMSRPPLPPAPSSAGAGLRQVLGVEGTRP